MDDKNNSYDENPDPVYENDFDDDAFEIGIPVDEALTPLAAGRTKDDDLDDRPDGETAADSAIESGPATESAVNMSMDMPPDIPMNMPMITVIKNQIDELSNAFESKLKYDAHKNKIIDDLHRNLQDFREGLVKKYIHRIIMDIIKVVDDMRKFTIHYKNQADTDAPTDEKTEKLLKYIENTASDLEDLFSWEGVVPFSCEGDVFDPARQRVLKKIDTDDPEKDKIVAERLRPGYEWDGKVVRPEMVSAYAYHIESTSEDNNNS